MRAKACSGPNAALLASILRFCCLPHRPQRVSRWRLCGAGDNNAPMVVSDMPDGAQTKSPYAEAFRQQHVEFAASDREVAELAGKS